MFILMPIIFVVGILVIALEDKVKINKAATALFMAISLWMILMFDAYNIFVERANPLFAEFLVQNPEMANLPAKDQFINFITNRSIVYHLGNVAETLFFVMCSMLIVDIVDKHGGFRAVTGYIRTANKRKLWNGLNVRIGCDLMTHIHVKDHPNELSPQTHFLQLHPYYTTLQQYMYYINYHAIQKHLQHRLLHVQH